jgi:DNA-directed RNA polymerase specialized sigma24 family protein
MPKDLTSESFKKLLNAFSVDETEAARLYTNLRDSLIRFFLLKGISEGDEAADETIDRIAEKISQDTEIKDLRKYAFGVARFVCLERVRREQTRARAIDAFYLKDSASKEFGDSDELETFRECFKNLYDHERELLLMYFEDLPAAVLFEKRQNLAKREKIELNALRNRISRLRKRLEDCLGKQK